MTNIKMAHKCAREDKTFYKEVKMVDSNPKYYLGQVQDMLKNKTYTVAQDDYKMFTKNDKGKIRNIYKLDYFPHRIVQWALILQIQDILYKNLIDYTFSSLPGRGIHSAFKRLDYALRKDVEGTQFCFQGDIRKFYPSVDHETNKMQYRKIFKDPDLLWLIDMLIDSLCLNDEGNKISTIDIVDAVANDEGKGIAIGSLFSQWDGNLHLSPFDHWLKEDIKTKHYFRYCDDFLILHSDKEYLYHIREETQGYLKDELKLDLKDNYKIFPVDIQGIDFVGYRHFRDYVLLRKSIAQRLIRTMRDIQYKMDNGGIFTEKDFGAIDSYKGWLKWCNGHNLYIKWIKPLEPYYEQYYWEVIKGESIQKCEKHSRICACN